MEYSGFAGTLAVDISSTYTAIAQIRDISGPSLSANAIEVTHRDGGGWKEFIAGLRDGGEITFDIMYDPDLTTHSASAAGGVVTLLSAGTKNSFRISFADATATTATFDAIVTSFEPTMPMDDAQTADVTLKVSGAITWA
jgi:predicted secreted protein